MEDIKTKEEQQHKTGNSGALVKALAWPSFALVMLISFWGPLHDIAKVAPALVQSSESIKIGSVTLQVRKKMVKNLPDTVRTTLRSLRPDDIRAIFSSSSSDDDSKQEGASILFYGEESENSKRYNRFASLGLVTTLTDAELTAAQKEGKEPERATAGFRYTAQFDAIYKFLVDLIPEMLSELKLEEGVVKSEKK